MCVPAEKSENEIRWIKFFKGWTVSMVRGEGKDRNIIDIFVSDYGRPNKQWGDWGLDSDGVGVWGWGLSFLKGTYDYLAGETCRWLCTDYLLTPARATGGRGIPFSLSPSLSPHRHFPVHHWQVSRTKHHT